MDQQTISGAVVEEADNSDFVQLWNPDFAAILSFIFTPIFGSVIHALNWSRLGRSNRAIYCYSWIVIYLISLIVLDTVVPTITKDKTLGLGLTSVFLLTVWYFTAARAQSKFIVKELNRKYVKRSWFNPLCIAIIIWGGVLKLMSL